MSIVLNPAFTQLSPAGGGGGGGAILTFSDNFTRANGDIGTNWLSQLRPQSGSDQQGGIQITSNNVVFSAPTLGSNGNNALSQILWIPRLVINSSAGTSAPTGVWGRNQFANLTFQSFATTSAFRIGVGCQAKCDFGGSVNEARGYYLVFRTSGGAFAAVDVLKVIGGENEAGNTFTQLATSAVAPSAGDILELDASYNVSLTSCTLTYKKNGTVITSATDNSPLANIGYQGLIFLTNLGTTTFNISNFACGVL